MILAFIPGFVGIDNLNIFRCVAKLSVGAGPSHYHFAWMVKGDATKGMRQEGIFLGTRSEMMLQMRMQIQGGESNHPMVEELHYFLIAVVCTVVN